MARMSLRKIAVPKKKSCSKPPKKSKGIAPKEWTARVYMAGDNDLQSFGRVDVLVQSPGVTVLVPHANCDAIKADDRQRVLGANLIGAFQMARSLSTHIRVVSVAPGFITGRWLEGGLGAAHEPIKKAMEAKAPLGRVAEPEDVSAAIVSLICGSDLVTGVAVPVEGGMLIGGERRGVIPRSHWSPHPARGRVTV